MSTIIPHPRISRGLGAAAFLVAGLALAILSTGVGDREHLMQAVAMVCLSEVLAFATLPGWPEVRFVDGRTDTRRTWAIGVQLGVLAVSVGLSALVSPWFLLGAADAISNLVSVRLGSAAALT